MNKIRWGILGPGKIAHRFVSDLVTVDDAQIEAVASRDLSRSTEFSSLYGIKKAYGSYQELIDDPSIDIVYIATPHVFHAQWSMQCLKAGKAVLCEKPSAISSSELKQVIQTARENKLFYMQGLWTRFHPAIIASLERIRNGELGEVNYLKSDFGFYALDRDPNGRILYPKLAGGSLLDIGIYPVFLSYLLFGKPIDIQLKASFYPTTGAEVQLSMLFEYPRAQSVLHSSFVSSTECISHIAGPKGRIDLPTYWHQSNEYTISTTDKKETISKPLMGTGFVHEIKEVHNCLREGRIESNLWSHQNALDLLQLLDQIRSIAGIDFDV